MGRARVPTRSDPTPHLHLPAPLPGASSNPEAPADPRLATRPPAPDIPSSGAPVSRKQGAVGRSHPSADPQGLRQLEGPGGTQLPAHSLLMRHRAGEGQCPPSREAAGPGSCGLEGEPGMSWGHPCAEAELPSGSGSTGPRACEEGAAKTLQALPSLPAPGALQVLFLLTGTLFPEYLSCHFLQLKAEATPTVPGYLTFGFTGGGGRRNFHLQP